MSSETTVDSVSETPTVNLGKYSAAAGVLGLVLVLVVLLQGLFTTNPEAHQQLIGSYLYGLVFWTAISLGMYSLVVFNHMVRSSWTLSVLRLLEAGGGWITLTILGICFIPVVGELSTIYEWARPTTEKVILHKLGYLNPTFWTIRLVFFFAVWILTSYLFRRSVLLQEKTKNFKLENTRMSYGAASYVIFAITATFAFVDWVMSLEPRWSSTLYSLWFIIGSSLGAYALCVIIFNLNTDKLPFSEYVSKKVLNDQGNMLFVHTMLWGYTSLSQYLIMWNGNLPENTRYYVRRASMGWNAWGMAAIIGQFFIPFLFLLSPRTKKVPANLRSIAGFMFVVHIIDYTVIVSPALPGRLGTFAGITAWDAVSWIGFAAIFTFGFSLMFKRAAPFPTYDTRLQEAKANAH